MDECCCAIVRLLVMPTGEKFWICRECNAQFLPKKMVDWKMEHLTETIEELIDEQSERVRGEDSVPKS